MRTVILSGDKMKLNLKEVLTYSDLLKNIAFRDVTVRYKQTWLGIVWALVRPFFNIVVFGAISMLISKSDDPVESFLFAGTGIILWNMMAACITDSSNSLVSNSNLLTKVYFPKIILPIASVVVCLVDFAIAFFFFLILFIVFRGLPGPEIFLLPLFVIHGLLLCLGLGFIFSTLNVKYRDVNLALPFLLQIFYYLSPVFLSTAFYLEHIPPFARKIFLLNPFVFVLDGFRYCLYGSWPTFDVVSLVSSVVLTLVILILSLRYFLKFEKAFADYI